MASTTLVPVSEYLGSTYRPDCDYLNGELKERNVGEQPHAHVQSILAAIFRDHRHDWQVRSLTEQRVQVSPTRFRVPDICVLRRADPKDPIVTVAPLLCTEVLSKDDTLNDLQARVNDYLDMGVEHIWVIDPLARVGYYASSRGFVQPEDGVLRIEGTTISVTLAEVFAELDEE